MYKFFISSFSVASVGRCRWPTLPRATSRCRRHRQHLVAACCPTAIRVSASCCCDDLQRTGRGCGSALGCSCPLLPGKRSAPGPPARRERPPGGQRGGQAGAVDWPWRQSNRAGCKQGVRPADPRSPAPSVRWGQTVVDVMVAP